jgi:hypothetical protein
MPVSAVYSSSSVTELSDVSDAGSGMIITETERVSVQNMKTIFETDSGIPKLSTLLSNGSLDLKDLKNIVLVSSPGNGPQLYENDLVSLFETFEVSGTHDTLEVNDVITITDMVTNQELYRFTSTSAGTSFTIPFTRLGLVNKITNVTKNKSTILFKSASNYTTANISDNTDGQVTTGATGAQPLPVSPTLPTYQQLVAFYKDIVF